MNEQMRAIEDELVAEFELFDDPLDKYEHIIDIGKELSPMAEAKKTDDRIVEGCASTVWLDAELKDGKVYYSADSNTVITKGLIALLIRVFSGHEPNDILENDAGFLGRMNLKEHLTSQRSNGLASMLKKMKMYALAYKTQEEAQA